MLDKTPANRTGDESSHFIQFFESFLSSEGSVYSRGIAGIGQNLLCVGKNPPLIHSSNLPLIGNNQGELLIFSIPQKGSNIFLKETIPGRRKFLIDWNLILFLRSSIWHHRFSIE